MRRSPAPADGTSVAKHPLAMPIQIETTLLDLVTTMNDLTDDENELLAAVTHLVNSGKVVLRGNFAGQRIPAVA